MPYKNFAVQFCFPRAKQLRQILAREQSPFCQQIVVIFSKNVCSPVDQGRDGSALLASTLLVLKTVEFLLPASSQEIV
jgi:hypothetical protein